MRIFLRLLPLAVLLLAIVACNLPLGTPTAVPPFLTITPPSPSPRAGSGGSPTPSRSPSPIIMCTPPLCWSDETYTCGKASCPGGCGTVCATKTPDPKASPTPTFPVIANPCRLPTANPATPSPQVVMCASAARVKVGETFHFIAAVSPAQDTNFNVQIRDEKGSIGFQVNYTNRVMGFSNSLQSLSLTAFRVLDGKLTLVLAGRAPGTVEITIVAVNLPSGALYPPKFQITVVP